MTSFTQDTRLRNLFNQFLYLDEKAFYDKIRFYEQNEMDISNMQMSDYLWIHAYYLDAIFQIGDYRKYTDKAQILLQQIIYNNITIFQGENLYEEILQKRSCSFYHLKQYDQSIHIAQELLKLNPARKDTKKILYFSLRSKHVRFLKFIKAALVTSMLATAFLLLFEQIVVVSFFPNSVNWFLKIIAVIFV